MGCPHPAPRRAWGWSWGANVEFGERGTRSDAVGPTARGETRESLKGRPGPYVASGQRGRVGAFIAVPFARSKVRQAPSSDGVDPGGNAPAATPPAGAAPPPFSRLCLPHARRDRAAP